MVLFLFIALTYILFFRHPPIANASSTNATLSTVAAQLDEFTGWFDHYSRKYLGAIDSSHPILREYYSNHRDLCAEGKGGGLLSSMMMNNYLGSRGSSYYPHPPPYMVVEEYEPEFGMEDVPQSQLEELPRNCPSWIWHPSRDF